VKRIVPDGLLVLRPEQPQVPLSLDGSASKPAMLSNSRSITSLNSLRVALAQLDRVAASVLAVRRASRNIGRLRQSQLYMTAENCECRLDPWKLCRMMRVENTPGFLLIELHTAREL
jgi:hypothetical protein